MFVVYSILFFILRTSAVLDTITPSQSIKDGDTLISAGGTFELAFFSPAGIYGSKYGEVCFEQKICIFNSYLGIQYKVVLDKTVAWVANRETSLTDHSGVLNVTQQGILVLLYGMKLGRNFVTGLDKYLSSWKSLEDPAPSQFSLWIDPHGFPQLVLRNGSALCYRAGSWNGIRFTGTPMLNPNQEFLYQFELNKDEVYYEVDDQGSLMSRLFLNQSGLIQRLVWSNQSKVWIPVYDAPEDQCEIYSFCGAHAACKTDSSSSVCVCLDGFEPKSPEEWRMSNWSKGCVRMTELNCEKGNEFRNYTGLKLPDTSNSTFNTSMRLQECKEKCLKDCSCIAYANSNISQEGSGCLLWFGNLRHDTIRPRLLWYVLDLLLDFSDIVGGCASPYVCKSGLAECQFIVAHRPLDDNVSMRSNGSTLLYDGNATMKKRVGIIVGSVIFIAILLVGLIFYIHKRKLKKQERNLPGADQSSSSNYISSGSEITILKGR
ncbi:hypothetical protein EZV62_008497 [Acer yangbiense]|uniref:non-specific serine/threonine protein kinase n=1 Tax=Acer yangbiense TaxID=1000413 RepID=A0A5C7IE71_9ROSI|nr:hypothetical protein EZV62_008497 [Acer yangbiense]